MKTLSKLLSLVLILTISASAHAGTYLKSEPGTVQKQEERKLGSFKGIAISGPLKAFVKIGSEEKVQLEGDPEAVAQLITEIKDGILIIRPKTKWKDWNRKFDNSRVTAYVTAKKLSSLVMSGSGSIEVQGPLNSTSLATTLSGSGSMKVPANVNSLTAVISGSGNIEMNGKANDASITINGSGNFKGNALTVEVASTHISGSGSIYVKANKKIDAVTSGSGTVYYSGNPTIEKRVVGSGGVRRN
ncbi:head GIN domain-containing protein [Pedobacter immunditicola]|uniref:head GIN domain-containing protein n=1 Tax=Pedobacter immunditicola TaxID=3133440 RepID=UPI0030AE8546